MAESADQAGSARRRERSRDRSQSRVPREQSVGVQKGVDQTRLEPLETQVNQLSQAEVPPFSSC